MANLSLRDIPGVGRKMQKKLEECPQGLKTVSQIWRLGEGAQGILKQIAGPGLGQKIYDCCQGTDQRKVEPQKRKSIGAECNYGVRFNGPYGPDHLIRGLVDETVRRCTEADVLGGDKVTLKLKNRHPEASVETSKFNGHGWCTNHSKSSSLAHNSPVDASNLYPICMRLFEEIKRLDGVVDEDIRGMGVVLGSLRFVGDNAEGKESRALSAWLTSSERVAVIEKRAAIAEKATAIIDSMLGRGTSSSSAARYEQENEEEMGGDGSGNNEAAVNTNAVSNVRTLTQSDFNPSEKSLDHSFLEALPEHIQNEIRDQIRSANDNEGGMSDLGKKVTASSGSSSNLNSLSQLSQLSQSSSRSNIEIPAECDLAPEVIASLPKSMQKHIEKRLQQRKKSEQQSKARGVSLLSLFPPSPSPSPSASPNKKKGGKVNPPRKSPNGARGRGKVGKSKASRLHEPGQVPVMAMFKAQNWRQENGPVASELPINLQLEYANNTEGKMKRLRTKPKPKTDVRPRNRDRDGEGTEEGERNERDMGGRDDIEEEKSSLPIYLHNPFEEIRGELHEWLLSISPTEDDEENKEDAAHFVEYLRRCVENQQLEDLQPALRFLKREGLKVWVRRWLGWILDSLDAIMTDHGLGRFDRSLV